MTNPTKDQYENAARFAGIKFDWMPSSQPAIPEGSELQRYWTPHVPSKDAFELLCKLEAHLHKTSEWDHGPLGDYGDEWVDWLEAGLIGNPEAVALATFNLAAEIGKQQ